MRKGEPACYYTPEQRLRLRAARRVYLQAWIAGDFTKVSTVENEFGAILSALVRKRPRKPQRQPVVITQETVAAVAVTVRQEMNGARAYRTRMNPVRYYVVGILDKVYPDATHAEIATPLEVATSTIGEWLLQQRRLNTAPPWYNPKFIARVTPLVAAKLGICLEPAV